MATVGLCPLVAIVSAVVLAPAIDYFADRAAELMVKGERPVRDAVRLYFEPLTWCIAGLRRGLFRVRGW